MVNTETHNEPTKIHPLVALGIIIIIIISIRYIVKKTNGWDSDSIPIGKNIKEFSIPFTMTNQEEYFFGNGKYKLKISRNGSLEIIRSSGFIEWSTPKEKQTKIGSVIVHFDNDGISIKRNLFTVWRQGFFIGKSNPKKLLLQDNGKIKLVNEKEETVWQSHYSMF